jgi:antitoxin HigA-1
LTAEQPIKVGMRPTHPGSFLKAEVLDALGLSITRAAEILGVRRATLSDLVNEKTSLSPELALRFEKAFGVSMDTLLSMQAWCDGHTMRQLAATVRVERFRPE